MLKGFDTPVLLIAFNRPELTQRILERMRKARPRRVYFAVDGPRPDRPADLEKCRATQNLAKKIDWPCRIETLFSEQNLGCQMGPVTAMNWFFDSVSEGIILEDDVLADTSFFYFCQELLQRYRTDDRIASISGNNFQFGKTRADGSYYFSRYSHTCGWATWRRNWQKYDVKISAWPQLKKEGWLLDIFKNKKDALYWRLIFDSVYSGQNDSAWDYQWNFMCWANNLLSILPNHNLLKNIGFGSADATHTTRSHKFGNMPIEKMAFPLKHPGFIIRNTLADKRTQKNNYILWKELVLQTVRRLGFVSKFFSTR